jgi:uncharacterized membrane protein
MNKQKYLAELGGLLSFLSSDERSLVLSRFERRFDDAGAEGEAALIAELGSPMTLAIKLNRVGLKATLEELDKRLAPEPGPEAEPKPETETEPESEPEAEAEPAAESEPEPAPEPEQEPEPEPTPEPEPKTEAEPEPEPEPEPAPEPEPEAEPESEPEQETEPEPETKPEPEQDEEPMPEIEPLPEVNQPESKAEELLREAYGRSGGETFTEMDLIRTLRGEAPEPPKPPEPEVKTSVGGAILFGILMIVPGLPLAALSILLIPGLLIPGAALCWLSAWGFSAGMATMAYLADAMFVFGAAFISVGLGVLLLLLALFLDKLIITGWRRGVPALFNRLARKEAAK